ncbi:MAG: LCP family protein [Chloroflexi bacterium]|nr:LCP family protein [Chloroflexota bacterium]
MRIAMPPRARRGITWWHLAAFLALDGLMAAALVVLLGVALGPAIDIPDVDPVDTVALGAAFEAAAPPDEPLALYDAGNQAVLALLLNASRWLAPLPDTVPTESKPETAASPTVSAAALPAAPAPTAAPPKPDAAALAVPAAAPPPSGWPKTLNIVLLGSDKRPNSGGWRTDTIIVVAIDPATKRIGVIGVPRDMWVVLPNYANRVNTLDQVGGPVLLKRALQAQLGIPIHYYARIDFDGFQKAINAMGGVTVDVECRVVERDASGRIAYEVPSGPIAMDGAAALTFARLRHTTSDFDRMRRQEAVLLAVRRKLLSADLLPRLPELVGTLSALVQTDIPPQTIVALARLGAEVDVKNARGFLIDERVVRPWTTPGGAAVQLPDPAKVQAGVQKLWGGPELTSAIKRPATMGCPK